MAEEFDFSHLSTEEFHVLREEGTEPAWSGEYNKHYSKGNYNCRGCGNQLFESDTKFDSGSGWPSFDQAIGGSVIEVEDRSYGMLRVKCSAHAVKAIWDMFSPMGLEKPPVSAIA